MGRMLRERHTWEGTGNTIGRSPGVSLEPATKGLQRLKLKLHRSAESPFRNNLLSPNGARFSSDLLGTIVIPIISLYTEWGEGGLQVFFFFP